MKTYDPKRTSVTLALMALLSWLTVAAFTGCATTGNTPSYVTNSTGQVTSTTIRNFRMVEPGIYRSGQPETVADWAFVKSLGVTDVIKLNEGSEFSDSGAVAAGLRLHYFPVDVMQQLVTGPDPAAMNAALALVRPGVLIHCEHGQDRTGLLVGIYRLSQGWTAQDAYSEMLTNKFHPALRGLREYFEHAAEVRK